MMDEDHPAADVTVAVDIPAADVIESAVELLTRDLVTQAAVEPEDPDGYGEVLSQARRALITAWALYYRVPG